MFNDAKYCLLKTNGSLLVSYYLIHIVGDTMFWTVNDVLQGSAKSGRASLRGSSVWISFTCQRNLHDAV